MIFLLLVIININNIYKYSYIMQQQFYSTKRYIKIVHEENNTYDFIMFLLGVIAFIVNNVYFSSLYYLILLIYYFPKSKKSIIKLKYTKRIIRIYIIELLFVLLYSLIYNLLNSGLEFLLLGFIMLFFKYLYLLPFLIESVYENISNFKYIKKAKLKLKQFNPKIIAITGSYGKTSTKNYLYSIIGKYYKTLVTPKSYNTLLGITSFINKELNEKYDYLILEVGVDDKNGMNKFLKLFTPDISIVTGIAPQHMTTFKTLENIAKEKIKLAFACKEVAFINKDFELLKPFENSKYRYFSESEIRLFNNGFIYENEEYKTELFGSHLYINLLIAIKISLYLEIPKNIIKKQIENIKNTEHRFEPIYLENTLVIDDSYNSNFYSFNKAIDSVSRIDKYRILITPGLIELGEDYYKLNFEIAKRCLEVFDKILLVGDNIAFKEIAKSTYKIETFSSFKEAYKNALKYRFDKVILIENDLPDIFLK